MTPKQRKIPVLALVALGSLLVAASGKPKPATSLGNLNATGQGSEPSLVFPDPKSPGKPQLKVWAKAGEATSLKGGIQGDLIDVTALLFQHGVVAAKLTAPRLNGNNLQNVLVASGRVTVISLTERGTVLKADTIHWYPKANLVVADGHVFYRNGKQGYVFNTPHMHADTALKTITWGD